MEPAGLAKAVLTYDKVAQIVKTREVDGCGATQVRTRTDMRADEFVGIYGSARWIKSDDECVVFADGSRHFADDEIVRPDFNPAEA